MSTMPELGWIGFGAAAIGNLYTPVDPEIADQAVEAAWVSGLRYFDTAPHYGLGVSEQRLGKALSQYPREEYVLSSKVGRLLRDPGATWDFSRDGVLRSIDESLSRLGTDRLDIVYLHDPDDHWRQALDEATPALAELRDQGVISAFGAGMNQSALLTRFVEETPLDVALIGGRLTILDHVATYDLIPAARARGVTVVAAGVFNSGLLALPRPPKDAKYDYVQAPTWLIAKANAIADVCEDYGVTLPEAAIAYPMRFGEVGCVLIGMRDAAEVAENVRAAGVPVPSHLWEELSEKGLVAL